MPVKSGGARHGNKYYQVAKRILTCTAAGSLALKNALLLHQTDPHKEMLHNHFNRNLESRLENVIGSRQVLHFSIPSAPAVEWQECKCSGGVSSAASRSGGRITIL